MCALRRCLFGLIAIVATGLMVASCESVNKLSNLTGPTPDLAPTFSSIQLIGERLQPPRQFPKCQQARLDPGRSRRPR